MVRVDTYTQVGTQFEFLHSFVSMDEAVAFLRPYSFIPGLKVALIMYIDDRPVEIMVF